MFKAVWSIGRDGFDRIEALRRAAGAKMPTPAMFTFVKKRANP